MERPGAELELSWLREAYDAFAPIREELAEKHSEIEINDAIDRAVQAVRDAEHEGARRDGRRAP
jgi:hypothetical protein